MKTILVCLLLPINLCFLAALFYFLALSGRLGGGSSPHNIFEYTLLVFGLILYSILSLNLSVFLSKTSLLSIGKYKFLILLGLLIGLFFAVFFGASSYKRGLSITSFLMYIIPIFIALYGGHRVLTAKS
jgi:hypothetical protein